MTTSFTAWKRRIKPGVIVQIINHRYPDLDRVRPVLRAQGRAFTAEVTRADGTTVESWISYPPSAKDVTIINEDTVTWQGLNGPGMTIVILEEPS
jgi:hypothetical protein